MENTVVPSRKRATILLAIGGYANTGITIVQGLFLLPLYLHYIGVHTYGLWLASGGILGMLGLINFGVSNMLIQRVARAFGQKNTAMVGAYFFNGMVVCLCISLFVGLVGWIASLWLPVLLKVLGEDAELLQQCFKIALVAMVFAILNECLRSLGQALLRPVMPMVIMATGRILGIVATVWLLFLDFGLWAIPIGTLIAEGVIFILNLFYALRLFRKLAIKINLDKGIIKEYLRTSPALFMARSGNTLSQESEPLLITMLISAEMTTIYMVIRRAADMVFLIISVLNGASHSAFSHLVGEASNKKIKDITSKLIFATYFFALVGFSAYVGANRSFVSLWVGEEYVLNQAIVLFIGIGFFLRAIRGKVWQTLCGLGDFTYTSIILFVEGLVKICLSIVLLKTLGLVGIAYALILSCLPSLLILGIRLKNQLLIDNSLGLIIRAQLSVILIFIVSLWIDSFSPTYDSWVSFISYSIILVGALILTFILINWRMCVSYFKKGIV